VFRNLDVERLEPHMARLPEREVERGDLVSGPGLREAHFHLVLEGELASFQLTADGKRLLMEIVEPGGVDGLLLMAGLHGHFTEARKPSRVVGMSRADLERLAHVDSQIAVNLLQMMLARIEKREDQLDSVVQREPARRLARQLLALGEYVGRPERGRILLRPQLSHQMLADMLGLRRETVTLHLNALKAIGAVDVDDHRLALHPRALTAIVEARLTPPAPSSRSNG
jgi:CRP-like cAMP-binding protein